MRKLAVLIATAAALIFVPGAIAAPPASVLDGDLQCGVVTDEGTGGGQVSSSLGQTWCGTIRGSDNTNAVTTPVLPTDRSTVKTFDGVPLDVNVGLPDEGAFGPGPYPTVGVFHGYGGSKFSFKSVQTWLDRGYATYSITQRGFNESCQSAGSKAADPTGCANGFVRVMDTRYEVRDSQEFLGQLVDEDLVIPDRIAATGGSYGGGMSMSLAALKDRKMLADGTLVPWESPTGTPMEIAVASPVIPWTELAYALAPNGSNLDYLRDSGFFGRLGVMKESYVQGLAAQGFRAPIGTVPSADILGWKKTFDDGEPYDSDQAAQAMLDEMNTYHSSYGIPHGPGENPAPMVISSGFTDDLFPVNEATRYYNRTRAQYPNSPIKLFFGSFGHARGQQQAGVLTAQNTVENQWVDYYLDDVGSEPNTNAVAYTQTCPNGSAADGPYTGSSWASISPGEIRVVDPGGAQEVSATGGLLATGATFNPLTSGNPCATADGASETGTANYVVPAAPAGGYTMLGAPTVIAKITQAGANSQLAARLVDVSADGTTKTLVSRGLWRPENSGFQVFQLFANGWKVEEGHTLRLELLPKDAAGPANGFLTNYGRPSNGQQPATIDKLDLRIPVVEEPGSLGGLVTAPAPKVLPDRPDVALAPGFSEIGGITVADYANDVEPPCPAGTTGTTPPDCTPDVCPEGQVGTPPNCTPDIVLGTIKLAGAATVKGTTLTTKISCGVGNDSCSESSLQFKGAPKNSSMGKGLLIARGTSLTAKPGQTKTIRLKLTGKARKFFKDKTVRKNGKKRIKRGPKSLRAKVLIGGKSAGFKTVKRVGKVK
ncbi:MAG: CocE/NonD family hydrolase [Solirubrobacterales bacterium]